LDQRIDDHHEYLLPSADRI